MSSFNPQIITKKGEELVARALAEGGAIHWTRVALGDDTPGGDARELEELVSPKLDAILINSENLGETAELIAKFSNENISEEFDIRELGIFGKIEGDAESVLYSYSIANDYSRIPINSNPFEMEWSIYTQVTNGDKIEISINPTLQMLNKETADLFYVALTRTINGKQLNGNIVLNYEDIAGCKYDIGDYWITESIANPAVKWPGTTWEKIEGKVLLGTSSGYALGTEGGAATVTLTKANLPDVKIETDEHIHTKDEHDHTSPLYFGNTGLVGGGYATGAKGSNTASTYTTGTAGGENTGAAAPMTKLLGNSEAFSIMNPYRAVHTWRRTA